MSSGPPTDVQYEMTSSPPTDVQYTVTFGPPTDVQYKVASDPLTDVQYKVTSGPPSDVQYEVTTGVLWRDLLLQSTTDFYNLNNDLLHYLKCKSQLSNVKVSLFIKLH